MRLSEVLAQVDGLNKRFVYYLESQGYIKPEKIRKARISRRDYSHDDVALIRDVWAYYSRGYSVQSAQQLVAQAQRLAAYVLLSVPSSRWVEMLELLRGFDRVREVSFVYGQSADVVLKMAAPDDHEIFAVLNEVFDRSAVSGVPRILKVRESFIRGAPEPANEPVGDPSGARARGGGEPGERRAVGRGVVGESGASERSGRARSLQAYVLLKVPAKHAGGVLERLKELSGVVEASVVYGETDIVTRLVVEDQDELDDLILNRIQGLPEVESTRTFLVVGRMHWRR